MSQVGQETLRRGARASWGIILYMYIDVYIFSFEKIM